MKLNSRAFAAIFGLTVSADTATSSSLTAQEASKRDNDVAWVEIRRLKSSAFELSAVHKDLSPSYRLFGSRPSCLKALRAMEIDLLAGECHEVSRKARLRHFWSVIFLDGDKIYTETRFKSRALCVEAAALGYTFEAKPLEGICGNSETKAGDEVGE